MRALLRFCALLAGITGILSAQDALVQNAATVQPPGLATFLLTSSFSGNVVSPGMLAVLYPVNAGIYSLEGEILYAGFSSAPAPRNPILWIRPVGSDSPIPIRTAGVTGSGITFVVPRGLPLGGAELLYKIDNQPTQWTSVEIVSSSFALIRNSTGLATPAKPGDTVVLTGSGLGNGIVTGATVGGVPAPVTFAAPHRKQAGLDEIAIQIPAAAPDGCYVPMTIAYDQTTITSTISKTSDGSPCSHPFKLSVSDMRVLDSGGAIATGIIYVNSELTEASSSDVSRTESATFSVSQSSAATLAALFAPNRAAAAPGCGPPVTGVGGVIPTFAFRTGDFLPGTPPLPDIGTFSTVQNPAGGWTWHSNGGKDLPPSTFSFRPPPPIQLNGGVPLSLRRDRDQTITWNGAAYDSGANVNLLLSANLAIASCVAPASTGTLTIPAALLSRFRANSTGTLNVNLTENGAAAPSTQFKLNNGQTLLMLVQYTSSDSRPVDFQ